MSRQQKRQQREADILAATIQLLEERSFLDLRMSDIAKSADCSMGAVYSHFSSKEDLLLGAACTVSRCRLSVMEDILITPIAPWEKMVLLALIMWRLDDMKPQHYQLQQLAMNRSVWERASSQRSHEVNELSEYFHRVSIHLSKDALTQIPNIECSDENASEMEVGLFGLTLGLYQIKESGFETFANYFKQDKGLRQLINLIERYLAGWGINPKDYDQRVEYLGQLSVELAIKACP